MSDRLVRRGATQLAVAEESGSLGMSPTRDDEIFRMVSIGTLDLVSTGTLDPSAVVSEAVGLEDVNEKLEAMTDFGTVGIPVIDSFYAGGEGRWAGGGSGTSRRSFERSTGVSYHFRNRSRNLLVG